MSKWGGSNNVLRKCNRDSCSVAVGLWGILILGAWACVVLTEKRHPRKGGLTEMTSQAKCDSSPNPGSATGFTRTDLSANGSSGAVISAKSPVAHQRPTEGSPKESLGWAQITAGSTPSPVFVLSPKISYTSDQPNRSESLSPYKPNSTRTFRRKAPYQSRRSSRQLADAEAKKRLLELWHRGLAKSETRKIWATFSSQDKKKKAAGTARKKEP